MCRLFAMSGGPSPVSATFWLLDASDSLLHQSRANSDGTGLGWFDEHGYPYVDKLPIAGHLDAAFAADARRVRARTILAHVRYATSTPLTRANTHPFLQDGRLFGHNGIVGDVEKIEAHLGADASRLRGESDSERYFALISHEIAKAGGDERQGIINAVDWLADEAELYSLNFVMTTSTDVWALRYPAGNTLYLLESDAAGQSPLGHPFASDNLRGLGVASPDTAHQSSVIIASEPLNGDDWQEIASGELIHVSPDLTVTREQIIDREPAHLMMLGGHAAAAQGIA